MTRAGVTARGTESTSSMQRHGLRAWRQPLDGATQRYVQSHDVLAVLPALWYGTAWSGRCTLGATASPVERSTQALTATVDRDAIG